MRRRLRRLRRAHPGQAVEVWAQDEGRFGLKPIARRVWSLKGLPPCTPELQPAEPLWPLVREAVANRSIGRIDRLRALLRGRLAYLARNPEVVQPIVGFRWAARLEQ